MQSDRVEFKNEFEGRVYKFALDVIVSVEENKAFAF